MSWVAVLVAGSVAVAAAAQMLSGLGFALIASPLLIATVGHAEGVGLTLVMSLVLNAVVLTRSHQDVRWGEALGLLVPAAVLVAPTLLFAKHLSSAAVSGVAGVVILIAVALVSTGRRPAWVQGRGGAVAAGAASGVLNVLAGTSGPPVALFVAARGWTPRVAAATLQAYALPLNLLTLAAVGLPTAAPGHLAWTGTGLVTGTAVAWPLIGRVKASLVRAFTLTAAAAGGLLLITQALTHR